VSSAWGAVEIPAEESDSSAALQLADVRMYAQKESRRLAHPDPLEPMIVAASKRRERGESSLSGPANQR
jgi:hypothetical protein